MIAHATASITLQLRELAQLFNSMDPSPFHDRDLDADAEEFIVGWARELPAGREPELAIHLATPPTASEADVAASVHHYFETRAAMKDLELRQLFRRGRTTLLVGVLFLSACLFASEFLPLGPGAFANVVKESLVIVGWVAMWRPLELYLYDWWPLRAERRVLERLARMRVTLFAPVAAR